MLFDNEAKAKIIHKLTNVGAWPVEAAPWAITVMKGGGLEIIPQPTRDTGLINNRVIGVWPYTKLNDGRIFFGNKYITVLHDKNATGPLKIGINSEHGYAAYINRGNMFIKYFDTDDEKTYPDGGMSCETYSNSEIMEIESLGPLQKINPGKTVEHIETWQLFSGVPGVNPKDEDAIGNILNTFCNL